MGFSFSGVQKELASERFKRFYAELRSECPLLDAFPSPSSLISFFHDRQNREYGRKDSILSFLIVAYRRGGKYGRLAPFFIALFTTAIASVYSMARKIYSRIDDEEFFQDACLMLLQIIREGQIVPSRVAMLAYDDWSEETIKLRGERLADIALRFGLGRSLRTFKSRCNLNGWHIALEQIKLLPIALQSVNSIRKYILYGMLANSDEKC